jgi:hypothetical protein
MTRLSDCEYVYTAQYDYRYKAVIRTTTIYWHTNCFRWGQVVHHSTCSLFDDTSTASSKPSYPRSGIYHFYCNFPYPLVFFASCSSCLHLLPRLHISSNLRSIFHSRRQFLHKSWPIQLASHVFILCNIFVFSFTPCNTNSFLTPDNKVTLDDVT